MGNLPITALGLAAVDYGENLGIGDFKALLKSYGLLVMKSHKVKPEIKSFLQKVFFFYS